MSAPWNVEHFVPKKMDLAIISKVIMTPLVWEYLLDEIIMVAQQFKVSFWEERENESAY